MDTRCTSFSCRAEHGDPLRNASFENRAPIEWLAVEFEHWRWCKRFTDLPSRFCLEISALWKRTEARQEAVGGFSRSMGSLKHPFCIGRGTLDCLLLCFIEANWTFDLDVPSSNRGVLWCG